MDMCVIFTFFFFSFSLKNKKERALGKYKTIKSNRLSGRQFGKIWQSRDIFKDLQHQAQRFRSKKCAPGKVQGWGRGGAGWELLPRLA